MVSPRLGRARAGVAEAASDIIGRVTRTTRARAGLEGPGAGRIATWMERTAAVTAGTHDNTTTAAPIDGIRLAHWVRPLRGLILGSIDMAIVLSAITVAIRIWADLRAPKLTIGWDVWPLLLLFPLVYAAAGLYPGFGLGAVENLRRLTLSTSLVFFALIGIGFVTRAPQLQHRGPLLLAWLILLPTLPLARFAALRLVHRSLWWGEPTVVIGSGELARATVEGLRNALTLGYRPLWIASDEAVDASITGLRHIPMSAVASLADVGVRVLVIARRDEESLDHPHDQWRSLFQHVIVAGHRFTVEGVQSRNLGGVLGIEYVNQLLRRRARWIKRTIDIVLGSVVAVLALPLVLLAAVAVKLSSRGPVFYRQEREGLYGRWIHVTKLRTMYVDAEERLEKHLEANPAAREEWTQRVKLERDPRVVPVVGTFLRRFSIDELPQLLSVLRGEMSLVGPRPFPDYHLDRMPAEFRQIRRQVRPGLTGLWQVMARTGGGLDDQVLHDEYYVRNWSIWMDLYILARTLLVVIFGDGE